MGGTCLGLAAGALAVAFALPAFADDTPPAPDKSGFNLFDPTPAADLRTLCPDRPTKANGPCTVDAGHWQLETDIYNVTWQTADGVTSKDGTSSPTRPWKLGVTNTLDLELNILRLTSR